LYRSCGPDGGKKRHYGELSLSAVRTGPAATERIAEGRSRPCDSDPTSTNAGNGVRASGHHNGRPERERRRVSKPDGVGVGSANLVRRCNFLERSARSAGPAKETPGVGSEIRALDVSQEQLGERAVDVRQRYRRAEIVTIESMERIAPAPQVPLPKLWQFPAARNVQFSPGVDSRRRD